MNKAVRNRLFLYVVIGTIIIGINANSLMSSYKELVGKQNERDQLQAEMMDLEEEQTYLKEELIKFEDPEYILIYAKKNHLFTEEGTIKFRIPNKTSE
jgi:cell division protein DivIC